MLRHLAGQTQYVVFLAQIKNCTRDQVFVHAAAEVPILAARISMHTPRATARAEHRTGAAPMKLDQAQLLLEEQPISIDVLLEKYAKGDEKSIDDVRRRVARGLAAVEKPELRTEWERRFYEAMVAGFIPGGRVNSAAGTEIAATLINCFVQPVGDAISGVNGEGLPSIYLALNQAAETMRRGGGVGYDFSAIRPRGALVKGTHSRASGPLSYMRVFDKSCETLESAGSRRGAQMGMMRCDHPDIEDFIHAKRDGSLSNFNMSVAVTDAFMRAVDADGEIELWHRAEPFDKAGGYQRADGTWVYRKARARELFDQVMQSTYNHAEPGVVFIDRVNQDNNLSYCETIAATNPCVTADTWVLTIDGPRQVSELIGTRQALVVDGEVHLTGPEGFFSTGRKPVVHLSTRDGFKLRLTADHRVLRVAHATGHRRETEWVAAADLRPGDRVVLHNHRALSGWSGAGSEAEGYLLGFLLGDGTLKEEGAVLSVFAPAASEATGGSVLSLGSHALMDAVSRTAEVLRHRADHAGWSKVSGRAEWRFKSAPLRDLASDFGMRAGAKQVPAAIERASSAFYRGFLRGIFDTEGSVQGNLAKGVSVRLAPSDLARLEAIQRMLARLGIISTIYRNRRAAHLKALPDGKGGRREYAVKAQHELLIANDNVVRFADLIGFADRDKQTHLTMLLREFRRAANRERFWSEVDAIDADGEADVYDVSVPGLHAFDANGIYAHNCGEQPLPSYGCCCLGSINLTRFVVDPFGASAGFDFARFRDVVRVSVRALDNVLDATLWPLPEQNREAMNKRRVGLGFTGLANTLTMLNLRYDSDAGLKLAGDIACAMRDAAYEASVDLAKEKGRFPLFDADKFLAPPHCASRLPDSLKAQVRVHGVRNSHLLSIAPTGTISLAFAGNASGGIEPTFSWTYIRKKRMPDGTKQEYVVEDYAYRMYRHLGGDEHHLPASFVHALEMSARDHMKMIAAVQPYVDAAVSKTVNVPEDYPFEEFKNLYFEAWKAGLKGITTYRPNAVIGSVLEVKKEPETQEPQDLKDDPDRRVRLDSAPQPALASLKWPSRPDLAEGNMAWTYMVEVPGRNEKFAIFIGQVESNGGRAMPFEVWVNGAEQPRGLGAIAKALSMDMRSEDRAWLKMKLDALAKSRDEQGFMLPMPPTGELKWQNGVVAAFANIVRWRCEQLGVFRDLEQQLLPIPTPMMNALFSKKEPKAGPRGTMSWTVDVNNANTGDDFVLGVKELQLPDGSRRPYSIWLAGEYPKVLDGLCKLISLDMRVMDPNWIGLKLKKLLNFGEQNGEFWALVPGEEKSALYPSTVAYIATLLLHRYKVLGILDDDGRAIQSAGILALPDAVKIIENETAPIKGKVCPSCHAAAMIKRDGCEFCTACGYTGQCS
jgi:ribonucleoside-diphosphate reductase alpha chain